MELRRRDDRFFFRLPPPLPRFPFPVGPSVADSPLVLIAGEFGAFPSNSSKKSCNQIYTINAGSSQPGGRSTMVFGRYVNPMSTRGILCPPHFCVPPRVFSDLPLALYLGTAIKKQTNHWFLTSLPTPAIHYSVGFDSTIVFSWVPLILRIWSTKW